AVVAALLAKSPQARFGSIGEARAALVEIPDAAGSGRARTTTPAPVIEPAGTTVPPMSEERWHERAALGTTAWSELSRAVDGRLGRPVLIEQFAAPLGEHLARLHALARAGGPGLQRLLHLDAAAGRAVFESPAGQQLGGRVLGPGRAAVIARALSTLHAAGHAHGA